MASAEAWSLHSSPESQAPRSSTGCPLQNEQSSMAAVIASGTLMPIPSL